MDIDFDPGKDITNQAKHGVSLAQAEELEWEELLAIPDKRDDYGEQRYIGYAPIGRRLYCVVFTDRSLTRRIISLRKANSREVKRYVEHQ
ncbi:BrnT family toxin [Halospina sp. K52047b]|uniref:BrnT family toxin n=1 Tax=Halospina sp. K52047b TaxID=2614160 RepID=UPI00124A9A7B|nr:BrnT family toxin [Halospina sp. K52047b]KAA8985149.1 BrnT family toxin [Halospina sp. K52047b]